jgi:GxxExxY protein
VIVELKAVPELLPLHRAQLLSYLKGYNKPLGILANFGSTAVEHYTLPNQLNQKHPLTDRFDYDKVTLKQKAHIKELLLMANRVLVSLGAGYFHQIYRRALYCELKAAHVEFEVMKQVTAMYQNQTVGSREVNFFKIDDLLVSAVAVQTVDDTMLIKFRNYLKHLHCRHGVLFNFNATVLDFRYLEL